MKIFLNVVSISFTVDDDDSVALLEFSKIKKLKETK